MCSIRTYFLSFISIEPYILKLYQILISLLTSSAHFVCIYSAKISLSAQRCSVAYAARQQSLIGGKFFAVMFWLIAVCHCHSRWQHVALITVATVARKMLQQLFFYEAAEAATAAAKALTVNCGMPSLFGLSVWSIEARACCRT